MIRRVYITSGLILYTFVVTHLLNHMLGLISLAAMEEGSVWFLALWRNPVGSIIFYGALLTHLLLACWAIYRRRSFKLRPIDWVQLLLGLSIPGLLFIHIVNTRLAHELFGVNDFYVLELALFFVVDPNLIYRQMTLLLIVWVHGSIGIHQWLRLKVVYRRFQWLALSIFLLLPAGALAGVWSTGRDIIHRAAREGWIERILRQHKAVDRDEFAFLVSVETWMLAITAGCLIFALILRPLRHRLARQAGMIQISYPDGKQATIRKGSTILEASRSHNIPHASVCGGRGRCSTCRIRVGQGVDQLPQPSMEEMRVLERIGAANNVRLACQLRPDQDCSIVPLLQSTLSIENVGSETSYADGKEREIVVLFADLRGFTALSEQKLPYDVVFLLNRYFAAMSPAITEAGGYVDKFVGDGIMALFGLETSLEEASRSALKAASTMSHKLVKLNESLKQDLPEPLRLGIGLHGGPVIVGKMGYGRTSSLTAVGDTVNTASRLEASTKSHKVQLVMSEIVAKAGGLANENAFETFEVALRGRQEPMIIYLVPDAKDLAKN